MVIHNCFLFIGTAITFTKEWVLCSIDKPEDKLHAEIQVGKNYKRWVLVWVVTVGYTPKKLYKKQER